MYTNPFTDMNFNIFGIYKKILDLRKNTKDDC